MDGGELYGTVTASLRAAGCVFAEDEARLLVAAAVGETELAALVERRVAGAPLEQLLGWAEFCGLRIAVEPGVFVPRRRTELLVQEIVRLLRDTRRTATAGPVRPVVVDLCCGSGAVAAAVLALTSGLRPEEGAHAVEDRAVEIYAADIEPAAVRCARRTIGAGGEVFEGDLDEPLPGGLRGRVDILVANAPYVPTAEIAFMPAEARLHEPRSALDGGADGLDIARRVAAVAPGWLAPTGRLLIETSERQAPRLVELMATVALPARVVRSEELDATVVIGSARPVRRSGRS
jgi:release factor glutamine methyltransferase